MLKTWRVWADISAVQMMNVGFANDLNTLPHDKKFTLTSPLQAEIKPKNMEHEGLHENENEKVRWEEEPITSPTSLRHLVFLLKKIII